MTLKAESGRAGERCACVCVCVCVCVVQPCLQIACVRARKHKLRARAMRSQQFRPLLATRMSTTMHAHIESARDDQYDLIPRLSPDG